MGDRLTDYVVRQHEESKGDGVFTFRQWLAMKAVMEGTPLFLAIEAVMSTETEHPEWSWDESRTWDEWEDGRRGW